MSTDHSGGFAAPIVTVVPDDGGSNFHRNISILLSDSTTLHPGRQILKSAYSLWLWIARVTDRISFGHRFKLESILLLFTCCFVLYCVCSRISTLLAAIRRVLSKFYVGMHKSLAPGRSDYWVFFFFFRWRLIWNVLYVTFLGPKILLRVLDFWKICAPIFIS